MRSSRLVGREINNQTINFSVNVSIKVAFVLTRGHEVSMVYHSLRNSVLPLCFVTARPPQIASVAELIRKKNKQTNKQGTMVEELYCRNIFTSVRPLKCTQSTRFILGGSPYPGKDGKKMAKLLEEGYRMPKPQHVDEKLYEKIVLLLLFSLYVLIAETFI